MLADHLPWIRSASSLPGQGGIVTPNMLRALSFNARNWNDVPTGMVRHVPGKSAVTSS